MQRYIKKFVNLQSAEAVLLVNYLTLMSSIDLKLIQLELLTNESFTVQVIEWGKWLAIRI